MFKKYDDTEVRQHNTLVDRGTEVNKEEPGIVAKFLGGLTMNMMGRGIMFIGCLPLCFIVFDLIWKGLGLGLFTTVFLMGLVGFGLMVAGNKVGTGRWTQDVKQTANAMAMNSLAEGA